MVSELFLNGLILPATAAVLVIGLAIRTGWTWLNAAAIAAALLAASIGLGGAPQLWPGDATGLLGHLAILAVPIAVASRRVERTRLRWSIRLVFVAAGVALLIEPLSAHAWSLEQALVWWAVLTSMLALAWVGVERLADGGFDLAQSAVVTVALGGGAAATAAIATLVLGIHAGALTTAVGLAAIVGRATDSRVHPEAVATLVPLVGFVWVVAFLYGGIPGGATTAIAAAPLVALGAIAVGRRVDYPRAAVALAALIAIGAVGSSMLIAEQLGADAAVEESADDSGSYVPY